MSPMPDQPPTGLTPSQLATLERFLRAGFRFLTLERYARYLAVEKNGFVALIDPASGKLTQFSQVGYRIGDGIGMLVEAPEEKAFVWHNEKVPATKALLATYDDFRRELQDVLNTPPRQQ